MVCFYVCEYVCMHEWMCVYVPNLHMQKTQTQEDF